MESLSKSLVPETRAARKVARGVLRQPEVLDLAVPAVVSVKAIVDSMAVQPSTIVEADGGSADVFSLPNDEVSLVELLSDLFEHHWQDITFGPYIQGAVWEMKAANAPTRVAMFDGHLTVSFGAPHFHVCIGEHKGPRNHPVSPALEHHRRTARAELYRRLGNNGAPVSWGLRLFNGHGEQQINVFLPNPFLDAETDRLLRKPDWAKLHLWDKLRARWCHLREADPRDRAGARFSHY